MAGYSSAPARSQASPRRSGPELGTLRRVADGTEAIYARLIKPITNYDQLDQLVEDGVQLLKVIEEDERLEAELAADFGSHFEGRSDGLGCRRIAHWIGRNSSSTPQASGPAMPCADMPPNRSQAVSMRGANRTSWKRCKHSANG